MEWTIDNILNKDNKITWLFAAGSEVLNSKNHTYTLTSDNNVKAFTAYIDSLDITESDKKKLKTRTIIPQRTHGGNKQDDLLNKVGDVLGNVCAAINDLGKGVEADYNTPTSLAEKIQKLTDLRSNKNDMDSKNYHSLLITCKTVSDTNQLLYELAAKDLVEAADQIKYFHDCRTNCRASIVSLEYLRRVLSEKLGSKSRRLCYYIDMDVVEELRESKKGTLKSVLNKYEEFMKDIYDEFDKWISNIIIYEKTIYNNAKTKNKQI